MVISIAIKLTNVITAALYCIHILNQFRIVRPRVKVVK